MTRALRRAGAEVVVIRRPDEAPPCDGAVLPGVGAFGSAMARLAAVGFPEWLRVQVARGTPLVGVCLGMQLLFERSEESAAVAGLGILPGDVRRLPAGLKVPHMGWNRLIVQERRSVLDGIPDGAFVY
ncbi:MAG: imidazole glycerol phosphate synthase subunit HisH, partial [Armatimonadetes bacterium]|nr:imidazole glycerol phosphate synthase subunit HisH [Armatimonadota bacterium]